MVVSRQHRIFIASPGDVAHLREGAKRVIEEINKTFDRNHPILGSFLWEHDVGPTFSKDIQKQVFDAAGDQFDIFLGVMWHRLGTKTPRAPSAFAEEYLKAIKVFRKINPDIKIWMCRYDEPISPSQINGEQLTRLEEFLVKHKRDWLQLMDGSKPIRSKPKFLTTLRHHLLKHLNEQGAKKQPASHSRRLFEAAAHSKITPTLKPRRK